MSDYLKLKKTESSQAIIPLPIFRDRVAVFFCIGKLIVHLFAYKEVSGNLFGDRHNINRQ